MITFFGASVTLQKNGYARLLSEKFQDEVKIFGYGGMHINNAGICFIDDVLSVNPDYCFVDFFSTVYTLENNKTKEYIDTIIYKFSKANCKLIFLFFPKYYEKLDEWYTFCKNHLDANNMCYIDVNSKLKKVDKNKYLKDSVHTNNYGSKLYSDIIFEEFRVLKNTLIIPTHINLTSYINIKKLIVEKQFKKEIKLKGSAEIIGMNNTIGPFSGLVEIQIDNKKPYKENIWDEWSYYTRKHFNLSFTTKNKTKIILLNEVFDTSSCKFNLNFEKKVKFFCLHTIYYIGDLEIENINEAINISQISHKYINLKGKLMYGISKLKNKIFKGNK